MVPILGTTFGSNFGYHFWSHVWVFALAFFVSFCDFGHVAAHSSSSHHPRPMANKQPTHRDVPQSVASHSAAHWVVMSSSSGYQKYLHVGPTRLRIVL